MIGRLPMLELNKNLLKAALVDNSRINTMKALRVPGVYVESEDEESGQTVMMRAAAMGWDEIITVLLEKHAKVDGRSKDGWTPLMLAIYNGHEPAAKTLIDAGAALTDDDVQKLMEFSETMGDTPGSDYSGSLLYEVMKILKKKK
jgi:ankyrin repeat protein